MVTTEIRRASGAERRKYDKNKRTDTKTEVLGPLRTLHALSHSEVQIFRDAAMRSLRARRYRKGYARRQRHPIGQSQQ